jgi:hypothetical protein
MRVAVHIQTLKLVLQKAVKVLRPSLFHGRRVLPTAHSSSTHRPDISPISQDKPLTFFGTASDQAAKPSFHQFVYRQWGLPTKQQ